MLCSYACAEDPTWWPQADLEVVEGTRLGAAAAHQRATLRQLAAWRDRLLQLRRRGSPVSWICQMARLLFASANWLPGHQPRHVSSCSKDAAGLPA